MKRLLIFLIGVLVTPVLALLVFLWWASGPGIGPDRGGEPAYAQPAVPVPKTAPETLKVLTFNVAYGRGPKDDKGDLRSESEVRGFLDTLAAVIKDSGADIAALQEVDFNADRTHRIDQASMLSHKSGLQHIACVTTWRNNYVPYPYWPPSQHYARMHSGQCVLSRFPLENNLRTVLPQPAANPFVYNWFYLHRALQRVDVRVSEQRTVRVFNVHLEAYDTPNKMDQARLLVEQVGSEGQPLTLVLGDFNCVPPEATIRRAFADEPETDMSLDQTIAIARTMPGMVDVLEQKKIAERELWTFPAEMPNRRLDYLFVSADSFEVREARVAREAGPISDHLPVFAELGWR